MSSAVFAAWPKTPRLNRDIVVTEKIDGTNAAVVILPLAEVDHVKNADGAVLNFFGADDANVLDVVDDFVVFAQSRSRFINPKADNFGFAAWVQANAVKLVHLLGPGRHFGEWWGSGIQSGYGLTHGEKRFSLFNVHRWGFVDLSSVTGLDTVPVLYNGPFSLSAVDDAIDRLATHGSVAAPGFMKPEGVIVYHTAARQNFKATLVGDESPKGVHA